MSFTSLSRVRAQRHWLFQLDRSWQGHKALVPVDICYAVLDVFAWTAFLSSLTSVGLLYLEHGSVVLAHLSFWTLCVLPLLTACGAVCRGLPFTRRFTLIALALLTNFILSTLEGGVMPNTPLYAIVLLAALCLFFGLKAGLAGLSVIGAVLVASAWGWTQGRLPLTLSAVESKGLLLDFRSPLVWIRVVPIMALFIVALLTTLRLVLQRLRETHAESNTSLRLLSVEQEQRAQAEIERALQAELLRVSERKYRTLFETANDAIFLMDNRNFVSCNPRTRAIFGCKEEEIVGQSPLRFSPPRQPDGRDSSESAQEKIAAAFAGTPQNFEWQHRRLDGTVFDAEVSLNRVEIDGAAFLQAIVRDITVRRRAEAALKESEAFRKRVFESSRIPIVVMDGETHQYVDCNQAAVEIYRFASREETLGKTTRDVSAPAQYDGTPSPEKARHYIARALTEGSVVFEWLHRRPNGEIWNSEVHLMSFKSGQRQLLQFTLQDITERKRTAEALARERHFFEALFEALPGNAFVIDAHGRYLRWNRNFEEFFGVTSDTIRTGAFAMIDTIHPGDREKVAQVFERGLTTGHGSVEYLALRADGVAVPRLATGHALEWDGKRYGIGVSLDISERVKAENALRESESRYRLLFAQNPAPVVIYERDTLEMLAVNDAFTQHYGYSEAEALALRVPDLYPESEKVAIAALIPRLRGHAYVGEWHHRKRDGSLIPIEVRSHDLVFGGRSGRIAVITDITERKRAEAERQALQAQLIQAQKMEAVGQLAGGVAHDFNNILTAILMHLDILREDRNVPTVVKVALGELEDAAHRATSLTRQLLMFSRRQVVQMHLFDLDSLLGNLLKMLRRLIGENISLELKGAACATWVVADSGMLEQVVMNLVVNARDAMPEGGRITLTTGLVNFDAAALQSHPNVKPGRFVRMTVTDTGCGMSEATQNRIFEPFFTTKEPGKGTGLGLATVYGIVQQHQGWVEVESTVGLGTVFRVFLPASTQGAETTAKTEDGRFVVGGDETILVAEDDSTVRDLACFVLQRAGYQVLAAANGEEATTTWAARKGSVDLLITDMIMPAGLTGLELIRRFRKGNPALKAILMSGYNPDSGQLGMPSDQIVYLAKPFEGRELARVVRQILDSG